MEGQRFEGVIDATREEHGRTQHHPVRVPWSQQPDTDDAPALVNFLLPELVTLQRCACRTTFNPQPSHPSRSHSASAGAAVSCARSFGSTSILALASTCKVHAHGLRTEVLRATALALVVAHKATCHKPPSRVRGCRFGYPDALHVAPSAQISQIRHGEEKICGATGHS